MQGSNLHLVHWLAGSLPWTTWEVVSYDAKCCFNGSGHCKLSIRQCLLIFNIFLLFAVLILSIKIIRKSKWEMITLVYSWKADGLCHKIWLVGHLCRHELWEESRRQCNFTGNIWAEIYKILGEGLLLPRWLPKFLIPALWKWNWELIRLVWMMMWELQCVPPPWFVVLSWCLHYGLPLLEAYKVMEVSSYSHQFIHSSVRGSRTHRDFNKPSPME